MAHKVCCVELTSFDGKVRDVGMKVEEREGEEVCPLMKGVGIAPKRADFYCCHLYSFVLF